MAKRIQQHLGGTLREAAMARQAGMSPSSFARAFRRRHGCSFMHHVARLRVRRACSELSATSQTVAAIAFACGFPSLSSFNRWFRAVTGTTPRAYRCSLARQLAPRT